jgi:hypothetical protein
LDGKTLAGFAANFAGVKNIYSDGCPDEEKRKTNNSFIGSDDWKGKPAEIKNQLLSRRRLA